MTKIPYLGLEVGIALGDSEGVLDGRELLINQQNKDVSSIHLNFQFDTSTQNQAHLGDSVGFKEGIELFG